MMMAPGHPAAPQAPQFAPPAPPAAPPMPQYAPPPPLPQASVPPPAAPQKAPVNWLLIAIIAVVVFILGVVTAVVLLKH
jgi:hypothetical protein